MIMQLIFGVSRRHRIFFSENMTLLSVQQTFSKRNFLQLFIYIYIFPQDVRCTLTLSLCTSRASGEKILASPKYIPHGQIDFRCSVFSDRAHPKTRSDIDKRAYDNKKTNIIQMKMLLLLLLLLRRKTEPRVFR